MFFTSKPQRLATKLKHVEDEIVGHIMARKQPPERLVEMVSRIKMDLEVLEARR